jgi:methyl-accepting chemotaxis protein
MGDCIMKLSTKMLLLIIVSVVGLIISSVSSFVVLQKLKVNGPIYKDIVQGKDLAADILPPPEYIIESYLVLQRLQDETDDGKKKEYVKEFDKLKKDYEERHEFWSKDLPEGEIKKVLLQDSYSPAEAFYKNASEVYIPAVLKGDSSTAATTLKTTLDPAYIAHRTQIDKLVDLVNKQCASIEGGASNSLKGYLAAIVVMNLLILLGVVAIGLFISRAVQKQLGGDPSDVTEIVHCVASGDLTCSYDIKAGHEKSLMAAMNSMVSNLRDLVSQTIGISSTIASASAQLQATAEQIATGAEEVASQTTTVATASEEMSATSSDIAHNCLLAADTSNRSSASANSGASIVQETIQGMGRIAEQVKSTATTVESLGARSEQIGEIVGTIEDIADQTNLLALNAAIEAARAGEQGRGFAVVADEVRALAERTTKATKEISTMIKAIQSETKAAVKAMEDGVYEVEKGAELSQKSGHALEEILSEINEVTMQINQIATASEEQTATTSEITTNIHQVTDVVNQTARGAEETSAAAAQLSLQAEQLQRLVSRFKV